MNNNNIYRKFLILLFIISLVLPQLTNAGNLLEIRSIIISATVGNTVIPPGGGGGGGGGGISVPTTVNISGMAYPSSKIFILKDAIIVATTIADPTARFSVSLKNLDVGTYNFSIYGEDNKGTKSLTFSFPIYVTSGTIINISGVFLSPTISLDKLEVKHGDNINVYGQTTPNSDVEIFFNSKAELKKKIKSDNTGLYNYTLNTTLLELGEHSVKSKTIIEDEIKGESNRVSFIVGLINKFKNDYVCGKLRGDLNCNKRVNIVDFSIMAFWYEKNNPPKNIDLNNDGKISLIDFSIMAYNWTG